MTISQVCKSRNSILPLAEHLIIIISFTITLGNHKFPESCCFSFSSNLWLTFSYLNTPIYGFLMIVPVKNITLMEDAYMCCEISTQIADDMEL